LTEPVAIGLAWRQVRDRFREANLGTPELDARLLAQLVFRVDPMGLIRREREVATADALTSLDQLAQRRLAGEPISRIIGRREFWGLDFVLNSATLDPRPETEVLVEEAVMVLERKAAPRLLDLGTGSGAIAIATAVSVSKLRALATDISDEALAIARENAVKHGVADRVEFRKGPWWQAVPHTELFDVIASNPPYIATAEIDALAPEVRLFDPKPALDGGWDGLDSYRAIASQASRRLNPAGILVLETGHSQAEIVSKMLGRAGFGRAEIRKDLAGLDRMVLASQS